MTTTATANPPLSLLTDSPTQHTICLAILPIQNLSKDPSVDMFCTGLVMDLITDLSRFRSFQLISYDITQHLNPNQHTLESIRVDYLVKGVVRYHQETLYFNLQLFNAEQNRLVWAEKFNGPLGELFQIQEEMVEKIVVSLQQFVDDDLLAAMRRKPLTNLNAYECWIRGFQEVKRGSLAADEQARVYFQQAIQLDPYYARAYTGMSLTYFNEWSCQLWSRWEVSQLGATEWALKALELDEWDHVSMTILGRLYLYNGEYEKAEHFLRKALRTNASDAENLIQIACGLVFLGYPEEALDLYKKARKVKPIVDAFLSSGAFIYFELGQFETALVLGEKFALGTGWVDFPAYMAAAAFHLGEYEKMQAHWAQFMLSFVDKINQGKPADTRLAVKWMMDANPYKEETKLTSFWTYITGRTLTPSPQVITPVLTPNTFRKEGAFWALQFAGQEVQVSDLKGCHDIARLLVQPYQGVHCSELMGAVLIEKGETVFDEQAKAAYRDRILELQTLLTEATTFYQPEEIARLQEEYDQLLDHLAKSTGLNGRTRKISGSLEKARTAVTWRIRSAIKKIGDVHPVLGKHLKASIKTGLFCEYSPEHELDWIV